VGNEGPRISFKEAYPTNRLLNSVLSGLMECDFRGIVVQEFILTGFETYGVHARSVYKCFCATGDQLGTIRRKVR
jgi:hypothetical protein